MSASDSNDLFGANSWLIDEMREAYDADPQSVDATWREFFAAEGSPPKTTDSAAPPSAKSPAKPQAQPQTETKPAPKSESKPEPKAETKSERPKSPEAKQRDAATNAPAKAPVKDTAPAKADSKPAVEKVTKGRNAPHNPGTGTSLSANTPNPNVRPEPSTAEPKYTVLRGAPMRTAKNMDTSLSVPTATSVRSVPMKLVIDQRTSINNFLRQSKGGKVSFTHLIGYAMVKALKAMP